MRFLLFLFFMVMMILGCKISSHSLGPSSRPNIIYILADDLGYGEIGVYGQKKIETPNLDMLAKNGKIFTQHYTGAPVCAPARYILLSGKHSGHAYIRGNDEWAERGEVWNFKKAVFDANLEGQRPMPDSTLIFPALLQKNGYTTCMIGKWGLGAPNTNSIPTKMGFDYFFGYNCQRQAHTYYPVHLYENEKKYALNNELIPPSLKLDKDQDPNDPKSYKNYTLNDYAPDVMYKKMVSFLDRVSSKPFFLYWATPLPHNPIQAPARWVQYYEKKFGKEKPYLGDKGYYPHPSPRAGYAAQISYLDEQVGQLVTYLKKKNLYQNTIIFFSSDNGATFSGGTDGDFFNSNGPYDEAYGKGKGFVYEGGIKVPLIAHWPEKIKGGTSSDLVSAHYDMFNTILELAGVKTSVNTDGISIYNTLTDKGIQPKHDFLMWVYPEYGGQVAIRSGAWKLVRQHLKDEKNKPTLELYDLSTDPNEKQNLADKHPDILDKMEKIYLMEHQIASTERFRIPLIEKSLLEHK